MPFGQGLGGRRLTEACLSCRPSGARLIRACTVLILISTPHHRGNNRLYYKRTAAALLQALELPEALAALVLHGAHMLDQVELGLGRVVTQHTVVVAGITLHRMFVLLQVKAPHQELGLGSSWVYLESWWKAHILRQVILIKLSLRGRRHGSHAKPAMLHLSHILLE
ncbi:hypothetical protein EYF80_002281 [Liparis tanakae]|uniref:Uncharacterized protein n=1 Tax=Liparis tanakae TaxID=230148 RepID=A0A4Z2JCK6_9TELE|nr:hypothetical protein EYF80_002281 [Liparis tanakae]